jgi:hypothetical protein
VGLILSPILSVLRAVPWWAYAIAACLAWGGWQRHRATAAITELAEVREAAMRAALVETTRRINAQVEVIHEAQTAKAKAQASAASAAAASVRLRQRADSIAASCSPGPAAAGPAASSPGYLLADMLGRLDSAGRELAAIADERGIAGQACERAYKSLTP